MAYVDHLRALTWSIADFRPLRLAGATVGYLHHDHARLLAGHPELRADGDGFAVRAEGLERLGLALHQAGVIGAPRGEPYAVASRFAGPELARVDRSAAVALGVLSTGVHVNGVVWRPDGPHLWIARRSATKATYPGKLDNIVAGAVAAGHDALSTLVKECGEEAGIPPDLAATARPAGAVTYAAAVERGLRRDLLYVFDLSLPEGVQPRPVDGEVESFTLMPAAEVARIVETSDRFKFNVNLVILDFLVRHGLIRPSHPDYPEIVAGLRAPVP